jgi:hypothetical protein
MTYSLLLNGRKVIDIEVDGVDPTDYPDFCDVYFTSAIWDDTGEELNEHELEQLTSENPELLNELAHEFYL